MSNEKTDPQTAVEHAIEAWRKQLGLALQHSDGAGNTVVSVPLLPMFFAGELLALKFEALFEELEAAHLLDPVKVTSRLLTKLEHQRQQAKASVDARPRVQPVGAAVAGAINGKGRG